VKVWEGPEATEIYTQDVPEYNTNEWTIVELDSAVIFDNTTDLYFGYHVVMPFGGFVTATDDGPPVDEYGNLVRWDGSWLSEYNNHNLRALISEYLTVDFEANKTTVCDSNAVAFTNLSNGAETYNWVFQGGTPYLSTLENPIVTYYSPGIYDVKLTITNGNLSITEQKQDYITVLEIPGQIEGESLVCDWTEEIYSVVENPASTYTWEVTNGEIVSGQGTYTVHVQWHDAGVGHLTINEQTWYDCEGTGMLEVIIDECTGLEEYEQNNSVSITPNPVTGNDFVINTASAEKIHIEIYNMNGSQLYEGYLQSGSTRIHSLNLIDGLYFVKATFADNKVQLVKFIKL
jgi:PKD repeat protein